MSWLWLHGLASIMVGPLDERVGGGWRCASSSRELGHHDLKWTGLNLNGICSTLADSYEVDMSCPAPLCNKREAFFLHLDYR